MKCQYCGAEYDNQAECPACHAPTQQAAAQPVAPPAEGQGTQPVPTPPGLFGTPDGTSAPAAFGTSPAGAAPGVPTAPDSQPPPPQGFGYAVQPGYAPPPQQGYAAGQPYPQQPAYGAPPVAGAPQGYQPPPAMPVQPGYAPPQAYPGQGYAPQGYPQGYAAAPWQQAPAPRRGRKVAAGVIFLVLGLSHALFLLLMALVAGSMGLVESMGVDMAGFGEALIVIFLFLAGGFVVAAVAGVRSLMGSGKVVGIVSTVITAPFFLLVAVAGFAGGTPGAALWGLLVAGGMIVACVLCATAPNKPK